MLSMKNQHIARLEAQLEQLVEGAFASLFGKRLRAQDIALQLARAMENGLIPAHGGDPRMVAPDQYTIFAHPEVHTLLQKRPALPQTLAAHLVDLATQLGYRLVATPDIKILADAGQEEGQITIVASHTTLQKHSTTAMQQVVLPPQIEKPLNAQFIIGEGRIARLEDSVINVGRDRDNHIIIDDPFVSRHHIQLRLRFGVYMLFDVQSQAGTSVNGNLVREHHLQSGDVVIIGKTRLLYLEDDSLSDSQSGHTQQFDIYP